MLSPTPFGVKTVLRESESTRMAVGAGQSLNA